MAASPVLAAFGLAFVVVGAIAAVASARRLLAILSVTAGRAASPAALVDADGPVLVAGRARKAAATVEAPYSETECLAYSSAARQRAPDESAWETIATASKAIPFFVEDDGRRIRIEPENPALSLTEETTTVPAGTAPPEKVRRIGRTEGVDTGERTMDLSVVELDPAREQQFVERRLDVGDDVRVFGFAEASRISGNPDVLDVVIRGGSTSPVRIAGGDSRGPSRLRPVLSAAARVLGSAVLLAVGLVLVLSGFPSIGPTPLAVLA